MHQIEEILKQLNEKSAVIQPGSVELLSTIQERLMRRSQTNSVVTETATPSPTAEYPVVNTHVSPASTSEQAEMSPLVRSILDSNRRFRGDQQQAVSQPRYLAQKNALVNAGHGDHTRPVESAAVNFSASEFTPYPDDNYNETYTIDRSMDFGFDPNEDKLSAFRDVLDTPSRPENDIAINTNHLRESEFQQSTVKFPGSDSRSSLAAPSENLPPPVPHFERAQTRTKQTASKSSGSIDTSQKLPIFDSIWFRRSAPTKAVGKIVDSIIAKIPPVAPATLQFTQSLLSKADGPLITTQIAWELSRRVQDDVLLVDADFQLREISRQLENVYLTGLGDMLNLNEASAGLVRKTGVDRLYWLPSGQSDVSFRKTNPERWSLISAELKSRFQYICIYSGGAEDKVAATWGRFCDFTFLIANMSDDLGPSTQQVIEYLRKHDSRISGLITVE